MDQSEADLHLKGTSKISTGWGELSKILLCTRADEYRHDETED